MEKPFQKTIPRTLTCGDALARCILIVAVFAPALAAVIDRPLPPEFSRRNDAHGAQEGEVIREIRRPRELTRIFSIIRPYRPDAAESEVWRLSEVIHEETAERQLDPLMVLALIRVESRFQTQAISPAGARGIMQIMPDTGRNLAAALGDKYGFSSARFTPESLDDPILNLRLGIHYLHDLKTQFQDWTATLTAYNFGPGDTLSRIENNQDLPETYAMLVINAYERYKRSKPSSF